MKLKRSHKVSLTVLGVGAASALFLSAYNHGPSLAQKQAELQKQEENAANSATAQDIDVATKEYESWTPQEKEDREKEARDEGYIYHSSFPWFVWWMIMNNDKAYTGYRPAYYYSKTFQEYRQHLLEDQDKKDRNSGSSGHSGYAGHSPAWFGARGGYGSGEHAVAITRGGFGGSAHGFSG